MDKRHLTKTVICLSVIWSLRVFFAMSYKVYAVAPAQDLVGQGCSPHTFSITSYYSPLAHQEFYIKNDEAAEKKLNGKGIAGASGKPVFNGMLAAPPSFAFGTKIYLPGRGWGEVADRGGAIVNSGERNQAHDRLDMRAGKGEAGLVRAISFGKPTVHGRICPTNTKMNYQNGQSATLGFNRDKIAIPQEFFLTSLVYKTLHKDNQGPWVRELQIQLVKLGYLQKNKINGYFGLATKNAVCTFQVKTKVLASKKSERCGLYGPQTAQKLKNVLKQKKLYPKSLWKKTTLERIVAKGMSWKTNTPVKNIVTATKQNIVKTTKKAASHPTKILVKKTVRERISHKTTITTKDIEQTLALLGYAPGTIDGRYDQDLKHAIIAFKQAHGRSQPTGTIDQRFKNMIRLVDVGRLGMVGSDVG